MAAPLPAPDLADRLATPLPRGAIRQLITGFTYPFRAFGFLRREPMLLPLAIMPAVLNFVLAVGGLVLAFVFAPGLLGAVWQRPDAQGLLLGSLAALWVVVAILIGLVLGTLWLVLVYALAGLVATPFTDYLTEQVEVRALGPSEEPFRLRLFARNVFWSVVHSMMNVVAWALISGLLLLLNLIPGVGSVVFAIASGLATSFFLAREMMDGCMTRRHLGWWAKQRLVSRNAPLTIGFGLGTMAMFWIPGLNLVLLPIAHVGGALLYARMAHAGRVPR
ncbi:MAG: EI24 domain-containing protein [Pseudomonadota bacterium]